MLADQIICGVVTARISLAGATYKQAAFAFQLAREMTNNTKATYKTEGSRAWLMQQPDFVERSQRRRLAYGPWTIGT